MFTLKIARTGSDASSASWIPGIDALHRIGTCQVAKRREVWPGYFHGDFLTDHAEWLSDDDTCSLLTVVDGKNTRYVICGTAWLLGPNGDTIERICP